MSSSSWVHLYAMRIGQRNDSINLLRTPPKNSASTSIIPLHVHLQTQTIISACIWFCSGDNSEPSAFQLSKADFTSIWRYIVQVNRDIAAVCFLLTGLQRISRGHLPLRDSVRESRDTVRRLHSAALKCFVSICLAHLYPVEIVQSPDILTSWLQPLKQAKPV